MTKSTFGGSVGIDFGSSAEKGILAVSDIFLSKKTGKNFKIDANVKSSLPPGYGRAGAVFGSYYGFLAYS